MGKKAYLTKTRFFAYQKELEFLESVGNEKIASFLAKSTGSGMGRPAFGPASELDRDFTGRISELRSKLLNAAIIEEEWEQADVTRVFIGATVSLHDLDEMETFKYTIVGADDVNIQRGLISYLSPIGSALLGRSIGDLVEVEIRKDVRLRYQVEEIQKLPIEVEVPESPVCRRIRQLD